MQSKRCFNRYTATWFNSLVEQHAEQIVLFSIRMRWFDVEWEKPFVTHAPYKFTNHISQFRWIHWMYHNSGLNKHEKIRCSSFNCSWWFSQFFHNFHRFNDRILRIFQVRTSTINDGLMSFTSTVSCMIIGFKYLVCCWLLAIDKNNNADLI